ncbi:HIT domain-containing protein, partial [Pantoea agglomerans]|uniref:HIT domain-containing protein n=1 Tax=Enterobacter agglomerans TaxID=549 RepID=UPI003C7A01FD
HEHALGRMFTTAAKIARQEGIDQNGYRLIVNCNQHGGQEVYHCCRPSGRAGSAGQSARIA